MTYSICVRDGKVHGAAIATKAPTVGSIAPFLSKNGTVCTQSLVNVPLGVKAARLMDEGVDVEEAFKTLLTHDEKRSVRQVHGVDIWGNKFIFSGKDCIGWTGSQEGKNYTIAGNMLEGEKVVKKMASTFEDLTEEKRIEEKLLETLLTGEKAGGDKRSERARSAALKVYHPSEPKLTHDLRVDYHKDSVNKLLELYQTVRNEQKEWDKVSDVIDLQRNP